MWFKRKSELCSKCGFLGWRTQYLDGSFTNDPLRECYWRARQDFQSGVFNGIEEDPETHDSDILSCRCSQWQLFVIKPIPERGWLTADLIRQPRKCVYYVDYHAGFTPDEHKELKRDKLTRQTVFKGTIIGAIIGAAAAIIGNLIGRFYHL